MALVEYWLGSIGPLYYDDGATYPDGTNHAGIYAPTIKSGSVPVEAEDVVRLSDISVLAIEESSILSMMGL